VHIDGLAINGLINTELTFSAGYGLLKLSVVLPLTKLLVSARMLLIENNTMKRQTASSLGPRIASAACIKQTRQLCTPWGFHQLLLLHFKGFPILLLLQFLLAGAPLTKLLLLQVLLQQGLLTPTCSATHQVAGQLQEAFAQTD
jgi:hypothetical protein